MSTLEKVYITLQGQPVVVKDAEIWSLEPQAGQPNRIRGKLLHLSLDEAVHLGLSGVPASLGFRSWRYDLRLIEKDGTFEANLHKGSQQSES